MDLFSSFIQFIQQERLFTSGQKLLVATSGGVDSVVLCELCVRAGLDLTIAHCNFQLRGEESTRDEQFVLELGAKYGREVLVKRFDTAVYATNGKVSIQVAARELRYEWFRQVAAERDMLILTAHHLNDNIETLLMNFFKGTGMAGLRGILPRQGIIVRPLLFADKDRILAFAKENSLSWVEDSSNHSDKYTRNYFRHKIIPMIREVYPEVIHNLSENIPRFREAELLYRQSIDGYKRKLMETRGSEIHIPVLKLKKMQPLASIVYEIIQPFGFSTRQTEEVISLLDSGSGKYVLSAEPKPDHGSGKGSDQGSSQPRYRILKNRNWLIISPLQSEGTSHFLVESADEPFYYDGQMLRFERLPAGALQERVEKTIRQERTEKQGRTENPGLIDSRIAMLDADTIQFPLLLRKWGQGDYFYPLGMRKKKKLGRFFIDNKFSLADKEKVWVLEMNKKIIWVVGHRLDDRFRITSNTRNILKIETGLF